MKLNKKAMPLALLVVALMSFGIGANLSTPMASTGVGTSVGFNGGSYCVCKNAVVCNEDTEGAYCIHNTITNIGKNATRLYLSVAGTRTAFDVLALSNTTPDFVNALNFTREFAGGLARGAGTVTNNPTTGNWSIVKTFTADGTFLSVNTTGIYNDTTAGKCCMLAGGTFTAVNLNSGDTLTINYTLAIS